MKNYYRVYGFIMLLVTGVFLVFEVSAVSFSFDMAFEREVDKVALANNQFASALATSVEMLEEESITDDSVMFNYMSDNIYRSMLNRSVIYRVYNKGEMVYTSRLLAVETSELEVYESSDEWYIERLMSGDKHYIELTNRLDLQGENLLIKTLLDISELYIERDALVNRFRLLVAAIYSLMALGLFLLVRSFEKNVRISEEMKQVEAASKRQEEFSASFAHECRTPLTSIIGYSDLMRSGSLSESEKKISADYIFSQGKRLERLTHQIMLLSNIRDDEMIIEAIEVRGLIDYVVRSLELKMQEKSIKLKISLEDGIISGTEDLYQSMLINILDNARKAVGQKGEIRVEGRRHLAYYELVVTDNGCGMTAETVGKMMEAFYMGDKARTRKEGGAGLGMAIVSQIVKRSKAKIKVQSVLGSGTSILLRLPLGKVVEDE